MNIQQPSTPETTPTPTSPHQMPIVTPTQATPYSTGFNVSNMLGFDNGVITADDIVAFIREKTPDSPMLVEKDIGERFIKVGLKNRVNPAFLVATAYLEGVFGTKGWAKSHPECHNTMGWGIPSGNVPPNDVNCAGSWGTMVERVAYFIAHGKYYYNAGLYTVDQIRNKYADNPNSESVASIMNELYSFAKNRHLVILTPKMQHLNFSQ